MRVLTVSLIALVALVAAPTAQPGSELKIYVIDVEGGGASLFVAPSGESLLVDTGNGDAAASRDAGRILEAASDADVKQIDHLVTTHIDHTDPVSPVVADVGFGAVGQERDVERLGEARDRLDFAQ